MANPSFQFGFKPISGLNGGPINTREYAKAAGAGTAIFAFDLVMKAATSLANPTGLGNPLPGIVSGQGATPGTSLWQGAALNYGAASTATTHLVVDEPGTIFMASVDGVLAVTTASHVGKNANVKQGTGNTLTKQSTFGVDNTTIATTAGEDLRIIRVSNISPNAEGANAIVEVLIIKHEFAQGTAGI